MLNSVHDFNSILVIAYEKMNDLDDSQRNYLEREKNNIEKSIHFFCNIINIMKHYNIHLFRFSGGMGKKKEEVDGKSR